LSDANVNEKGSNIYLERNTSLKGERDMRDTLNSGSTSEKIQTAMLNRMVPPVKLAALSVSTFSGEYRKWAAFQDIFEALIHNNQYLSQNKFFLFAFGIFRRRAELH